MYPRFFDGDERLLIIRIWTGLETFSFGTFDLQVHFACALLNSIENRLNGGWEITETDNIHKLQTVDLMDGWTQLDAWIAGRWNAHWSIDDDVEQDWKSESPCHILEQFAHSEDSSLCISGVSVVDG